VGTEATRRQSLVRRTSSCVYISVVTYFSYIKEFEYIQCTYYIYLSAAWLTAFSANLYIAM
jgi:hypothetical protein